MFCSRCLADKTKSCSGPELWVRSFRSPALTTVAMIAIGLVLSMPLIAVAKFATLLP